MTTKAKAETCPDPKCGAKLTAWTKGGERFCSNPKCPGDYSEYLADRAIPRKTILTMARCLAMAMDREACLDRLMQIYGESFTIVERAAAGKAHGLERDVQAAIDARLKAESDEDIGDLENAMTLLSAAAEVLSAELAERGIGDNEPHVHDLHAAINGEAAPDLCVHNQTGDCSQCGAIESARRQGR